MTQATPAAPEEAPALVEEEATSTREAPRHIQRRHPPQQMLGDLNERVTRSKIKQTPQGMFVHQAKYTKDLLWKFDMSDLSPQPTPISTSTALDADLDGETEATTRAVDPAVSATSSDDDDGPDPTTSTSRGLIEEVTQASPAAPEETPALVEEEATSTREAPRHIQRRHPPQQMLGDLNERVTRSKFSEQLSREFEMSMMGEL